MMKVFMVSILILVLSLPGYSQMLKGKWEGSYTQENRELPITLEFVLNSDSTYGVYTYTHEGLSVVNRGGRILFLDTVSICTAYYERLSSDSIYIEEIKAIHPVGVIQTGLQRMYLKILVESDKIKLTGIWLSKPGYGKINFWKKMEVTID